MRILYNGLFQQLKQAGINDRYQYNFRFSFITGVWNVQQEFLWIVIIFANTIPGINQVFKILKMGFPNKRIGCKRKRRAQYV